MNYLMLLVLLIFFILLLVILFAFKFNKEGFEDKKHIIISSHLTYKSSKNSKIPKIIWTYWHDSNLPDFVSKCIESLKYHNKDHQVIVLNNDLLPKYIPDVNLNNLRHAKNPTALSDFIRLHVLRIHGGIWCDASVICNKPFNDWIHKLSPEHEFIGFTVPKSKDRREASKDTAEPYITRNQKDSSILMDETARKQIGIESWFLAAEKGSEFIRLWCEEAMKIHSFDKKEEYLKNLRDMGVYLNDLEMPTYLIVYASAMKVFQLDKYPLNKLKLYESIYTGYIMYSNQKSTEENVKFMIDNKDIIKQLEVIKFNAGYRNYIIDNKIDTKHFFNQN